MLNNFYRKKLKKIIFLVSGRGSNFEACVQWIKKGKIKGKIIGLIVNNKKAKAIDIAKKYKIDVETLSYDDYQDKNLYHEELYNLLLKLNPNLIVTAGYMKILKSNIIKKFKNSIINIHPSLLPSFKGMNAQKQSIDYGVKFSGCTAHFVDEGMDTGPIILQEVVKVTRYMDEKMLSKEILKIEHTILPKAIQLFCDDKLRIKDRIVKII